MGWVSAQTRLDTVTIVVGRTGVVQVSPARLRAARLDATPTDAEVAARMRSGHRRNHTGITQAELAARIGHQGPGAISQWERGQHRVDVSSLTNLAKALKVDPLDLLDPDATVTLALLRARAGLSQAKAAEAVGISRNSWARIEAGTRRIWPDELDAAARALGVNPARVLAATQAQQHSAPLVEDIPTELLERLTAHRRPGESLADTLNRFIPPAPSA